MGGLLKGASGTSGLMSENYTSPTLIELLGHHANLRLITFSLLVSEQEEIMLQDLVGAPDEFEMLDLVHPLVWIWR